METATSMLVVLVILAMVGSTKQYQYEEFAQECRIYQVEGYAKKKYELPVGPVRNLVTFSFYNEEVGDVVKNIHIRLEEKTLSGTNRLTIHINDDGLLFLDRKKSFSNMTLNPSCYPRSWFTLAIMLQDQNIILYNINNRMDYISSNTTLGSNTTAKISTTGTIYVTANCSAGCLIHDHNSPLIGQYLDLANSINIYLSHEEGASSASITIGFINSEGQRHQIIHYITNLEASMWHKLVIAHNTEEHVIVRANGEEIGKVMISEENSTFTVLSSDSVLWSLHCHPDHATGLEGWGGNENNTQDKPIVDKRGAGAAEVVAWVLAGMALFLVLIMALFICTRMGPKSEMIDYGASVGVVTSYGRAMKREAEDTEPDSPTFLAPVIQHKVPEEEDEDQSNTKML